MSAITILVLSAGYCGLVVLTLALLTCAKRADEAADRHLAAMAAARGEPARSRRQSGMHPVELIPEDVAFLEKLDRRAASLFGAPAPSGPRHRG
jgi:hypothetical protein